MGKFPSHFFRSQPRRFKNFLHEKPLVKVLFWRKTVATHRDFDHGAKRETAAAVIFSATGIGTADDGFKNPVDGSFSVSSNRAAQRKRGR